MYTLLEGALDKLAEGRVISIVSTHSGDRLSSKHFSIAEEQERS